MTTKEKVRKYSFKNFKMYLKWKKNFGAKLKKKCLKYKSSNNLVSNSISPLKARSPLDYLFKRLQRSIVLLLFKRSNQTEEKNINIQCS